MKTQEIRASAGTWTQVAYRLPAGELRTRILEAALSGHHARKHAFTLTEPEVVQVEAAARQASRSDKLHRHLWRYGGDQ